MARRAGVVPFSLSNVTVDTSTRNPPARTHAHSQSMSNVHLQSAHHGNPSSNSATMPRFQRSTTTQSVPTTHVRGNSIGSGRVIAARRDSTPRSLPPTSPNDGLSLAFGSGMSTPRSGMLLPSVAELTTGVSPYSTPAYAMSTSMSGGYTSPGTLLPSLAIYSTRPESHRRHSPESRSIESSHRS